MSKNKLFVVSDIHSYYSILKQELDKKGFDPNNDTHWLIVCGDCFDRGPESYELLKFLMNLKNKILVRGNHDDLLEECCGREFAHSHDVQNGTVKTIQDIGGKTKNPLKDFDECCRDTWNKTSAYRNSLVNYFETENYIFVHGWIPCVQITKNFKTVRPWYQNGVSYQYNPDWRQATEQEWETARWLNGIKLGRRGIIEPNKTIVCGHWHCSYGYYLDSNLEISEFGEDAYWEPYTNVGMIAIDRCTAHTNEMNVIIIEDNFLEDNGENKQ